jgi:hypothetical protein
MDAQQGVFRDRVALLSISICVGIGPRRKQGSRVQSVEQLAAEEASGHRFVAWVIRHTDWPDGRDLPLVHQRGDTVRPYSTMSLPM